MLLLVENGIPNHPRTERLKSDGGVVAMTRGIGEGWGGQEKFQTLRLWKPLGRE